MTFWLFWLDLMIFSGSLGINILGPLITMLGRGHLTIFHHDIDDILVDVICIESF
jgi:hypothetical protein